MTILQAIILGLVEGITEYLPVSSTGHLIIAAWLLGLGTTPPEKEAINAFNIIIQGGAILAVAGLYRARVGQMLRGIQGRDGRGRMLFLLLIAAFLPAAILGPLLDDFLEARLFRPLPVIMALGLGGVVLIALKPWQDRLRRRERHGERHVFKSIEELTLTDAIVIGLLQCVAMVPGTSRSMMTILGGLGVGLSPSRAAEFSFLLGLPTLGAACLFKLMKQLKAHGLDFVEPLGGWGPVIVGMLAATISAAVAVKWLVGYLERHSFAAFGVWRIAVATVLGILFLRGTLSL
jgi:undecaprenyl-diphosphatase